MSAETSAERDANKSQLQAFADDRLSLLVGDLLHNEEGRLGKEWGTVIVSMAKIAVQQVATRTYHKDSIDFNKYVKIKRIPGGDISDCRPVQPLSRLGLCGAHS